MSNENITRVAAYGLLQRREKILLCRLSQTVGANAGYWTLPGGGLDFGEDPENAVVREFAEETGLEVKVNNLAGIDSLCDHLPGWSPMHSIRIIYSVQYVSGDLQFEQAGSTDLCAWYSLNDALKLPLVDLAKRGLQIQNDIADAN